ncbi:hypothetical protein BDV93DRAFT_560343 [Ceratobasidium sp. AG-I]|nr:hypothetical protein BDV93DRAFT_560343 [Ceratobasidium sp. AG-I]
MAFSSKDSGFLLGLIATFILAYSPLSAKGATCGSTHTITSGEGCWSIYTDAKITQAQLFAMNPGLDCDVLSVGQALCVSPSCSKFYTVQSGDYCFKIETEQDVSDPDFMALNPGISCDEIFPGQNVCVAAPLATPSQTTTPGTISSTFASSTSSATTTPTSTPVPCGWSIPVSEGDTCYNLATANGLQLAQFTALNQGLNCTGLQAGDIACVEVACGQVYKVQSGDWCAKIESDWSLAANQLSSLNPGLSCNDLAPQQNLCIEPAKVVNTTSSAAMPSIDPFPALSPGEEKEMLGRPFLVT